MIPQLKQEAQTDGKTGLWNARHFTTLFTAEMDRAKRLTEAFLTAYEARRRKIVLGVDA